MSCSTFLAFKQLQDVLCRVKAQCMHNDMICVERLEILYVNNFVVKIL